MTDSYLRDPRAKEDKDVDGRPPGGHRRVVVASVAAAVVVVAVIAVWLGFSDGEDALEPAGTAPSSAPSGADTELTADEEAFLAGEAPTPELLAGVWRLDNPTTSRMLYSFTADGQISYDDTGQLSAAPLVSGTYTIEDDVITVAIESGLADCAGQSLLVRAAVNDTGGLNVLPSTATQAGSCGIPIRPQWVLERILPASEDLEGGLTVPEGAGWDPPPDADAVAGDWLDSTGTVIVELRPDGTYTALMGHGEVADLGTWTLDAAASELSMVSAGDTGDCAKGDQVVLDKLRQKDVGALVLQADAQRNECGLLWTGNGGWLLAP
jgi:hypothetical protein